MGLFLSSTLIGQNYKFDHYSIDQGFDAAQALCIQKAKDGYLWVGTENGLYRYDGHQFKAYISDLSTNNDFSGNYINHISLDKHNRIWMAVGTTSLNVFDIDDNEIIKYKDDEIKDENFKIWCFYYDYKNDVTWISSNHGIYFSKGEEICLQKLNLDLPYNDHPPTHFIIDKKGKYWLSNAYGLHCYNSEDCSIKTFINPYKDKNQDNENDFITSTIENDSTIWLGGWSTGLYKFDHKNHKWNRYTWGNPNKINNGVYSIQTMKQDNNFFWLATSSGLQVFDKCQKKIISYNTENTYDPHKVPGVCFSFCDTDSEGLWIGTWKGLHRYDPYKHFIKNHYIKDINKKGTSVPEGISFENSNSKNDSIIWFVIPYGEVYRYDLLNHKMVNVPTPLLPYSKGQLEPHFTFIDSGNRVWISSYQKQLIGYNLDNGIITMPIYSPNKIKRILTMSEDSKGRLWFGCDSGLYTLIDNHLVIDTLYNNTLLKLKASKSAYNFTIDHKDCVWIIPSFTTKNNDVVVQYSPAKKEIKTYKSTEYKALAKMNHLEHIAIHKTNKIIISSFHGFSIGDIKEQSLELTYHDRIDNHQISSCGVISIDSNNIYITSDLGLIKYDLGTKTKLLITNNTSNLGPSTKPLLTHSLQSNINYISQPNELQSFNSVDFATKYSPDVALTSLTTNDSTYTIVPKSGDMIRLKYENNTIKMTFSNFNFTNSKSNIYEYSISKMSGWNKVDGNIISFEKLQAGTHNLKVRAANSFGIMCERAFVLFIYIAPPWYQTWWFQLLLVALISMVIYSFFKFRDVQREKVEKLRLSISRDLHDDMGSSLSHIKMMSERESMRQGANQSFKAITEITSEIMSNMTEIIWSINPKNDSLASIIGKIQEFAIESLEPQGINIYFDIDDVPQHIKLSPENRRHFYLIFKEAINNTAKYSNANIVRFTFKSEKGKSVTTFSDNGHGFDLLIIKQGNGLKNMESRAKALLGKLLVTTDEKGTSVSLVL